MKDCMNTWMQQRFIFSWCKVSHTDHKESIMIRKFDIRYSISHPCILAGIFQVCDICTWCTLNIYIYLVSDHTWEIAGKDTNTDIRISNYSAVLVKYSQLSPKFYRHAIAYPHFMNTNSVLCSLLIFMVLNAIFYYIQLCVEDKRTVP